MLFLVVDNDLDNIRTFYKENGVIYKAYEKERITLEDYIKFNNITNHNVYTLDEYTQLKQESDKQKYCNVKPTIITEKEYYEMFECLPPLDYISIDGCFFRFCMSEFYTGNITSQYAKCVLTGSVYYLTKKVVYKDESTYITIKDFVDLLYDFN